MQYWHFYVFLCCGHSYHPERIAPELDTCPIGGGVLPNKEVRGAWTSHQVWRQTLGQGPAKLTK